MIKVVTARNAWEADDTEKGGPCGPPGSRHPGGGMTTQGVLELCDIDATADRGNAVLVAAAAFRKFTHHDHQVSFVAIVNES